MGRIIWKTTRVIITLMLYVPLHATAMVLDIGSCDFEVTSADSGNKMCGYTLGRKENDDFFDWTLEDNDGEHYMSVKTEMHEPGQKARLYSVKMRQRDTHCYSFEYHIEGGLTGNDTEPANSLNVYVLDHENAKHELPVWQSSSETRQRGWTKVQLALNPRQYQVVFEANIAQSTPGVIALDNIVIDNTACDATPHFLRVSDKEVNQRQDVTVQCLLWGHNLGDGERRANQTVILQKFTGDEFTPTTQKSYKDHLSVNFTFPSVDRDRVQGLYRCVSRNATSAGISNFANVSVKVPPVPQYPPNVYAIGSTYLNVSLNSDKFQGDPPIIQNVLSYRPLQGLWSDAHEISTKFYHIWHLRPDTTYELRVTLARPGKGGRGVPGPARNVTTMCGVPLKPVSDVQIQAMASNELKVMWKVPDFSITQCHYHSYIVKYRRDVAADSGERTKFKRIHVDMDTDFAIIYNLSPYTRYEVKIVLDNSRGSIETRSLQATTGQAAPGPIPAESFEVVDANETAVTLRWEEPLVLNGEIVAYQIIYRGLKSTQPSFAPQLDSGLYTTDNVHNLTINGLHSGTTYIFSIKARTGAGFGNATEIEGVTSIAAPKMSVYPSPTPDNGTSSTPTTIDVNILPAEANGAPVSFYYIVVEEVDANQNEVDGNAKRRSNPKSEMNAKPGRKRKKKRKRQKRSAFSFARVKRQTAVTTKEKDSPCYADPIGYEDAQNGNKSFYFGGKLTPEEVNEGITFVVGEGGSRGGFENPPLDPTKTYNVYLRADSNMGGDTKVNCALVAIKASAPPTTTPIPTTTTLPIVAPVATTDSTTFTVIPPASGGDEITVGNEAEQTESDNLVLYAGVGAAVFFILLVVVIIIIFVKARKSQMRPKDEVVNPFEVRMMMSDMMGTANTHSMTRSFGSPDRQALMMPDVVDFENHDFMEKTLDASGTRVSGTYRSVSTPMVEDRPVLRVDDFHIHVNDMKRQNNFGFHEEFSSFRTGQAAAWDVGKKDENRNKNRYGNILAYDHSRVILQQMKGHEDDTDSDYINANYILGYKSPAMYISTQAPTEDTTDDFWLMVWQESTPVIVMVTNLVELGKRKCHKYWPDDSERYGTIKVMLTDTEELSDYTIRTFIIQVDGGYDVREVKQFHYTAWPDHGVPEHPTGILSFIRRVKSYEPPGQGSTLVHCSAGCGRTGCYIVIDMMLDMAREEGVIDIYNTVTDLRNRRVNMVQTEEQYVFVHEAVLEVLLCGDTLVAAVDLRQHYDDLITVDEQTQIAPVQEEFETLDLMTPKLSDEDCAVAKLPRNRQRNRFMDVLPRDKKMPYLVTPHPNDPESNYINAIFADSYTKRDAFVVTQMPLPNTVVDFWRLVYDYNCTAIVMMNDSTEHDQTCCVYWPDSGTANFGPFDVEIVGKEDEVDVVTRVFKVHNNRRPAEGYRLVQQFQLTNWPATQPVPYTRNAVLRVIQLVTKWQNENANDGRALIHCVAGAGRSGTFAACYNLCMQLRREAVVDVFNIVQRLRNVRPQLVETLEQYRFCYEVGWDFADQ